MVQLNMTLTEAEGHFCCLNLCNNHNLGNIACFNYSVFIHKLQSARTFDLNFIVKGEVLLNVTGSHVQGKTGNISETVPYADIVTTGR